MTGPDSPITGSADGGAAGAGAAVALEFLDPAVAEAALSVLSRKLRAELMLGLLEEFAQGRRSARGVLADFRIAADILSPLRADGTRAPGMPEWERLRQVGRAKSEPIVEWEILHALQRIATDPSPGPRAHRAPMTVDSLEQAMDLGSAGGLDSRFSLHTYLDGARAKLGPHMVPRDTETLAGTLRRIDVVRQMIKPGGLSLDLGVAEPALPAVHAADVDTARQAFGSYLQSVAPQLAAAAGIQMLRHGVPDRGGVIQPDADVDRALRAGHRIVIAQQTRARADTAMQAARQSRSKRLDASGRAIMLGGTAVAVMGAATGLAFGLRSELAPLIGASAAAGTLFGRALQDWDRARLPLLAPFTAWRANRKAARADSAAERAVEQVLTTHGPAGAARRPPRLGR